MAHNIQIMSADQKVLSVVLSFHFVVLIEHFYFEPSGTSSIPIPRN